MLTADANLKAGKDLIVASETTMRYEWKDEDSTPGPGKWTDPMTFSDEPGARVRKDADGAP